MKRAELDLAGTRDRDEQRSVRPASDRPPEPPPEFFTLHQQDVRRVELLLSTHSSPTSPLLTTTITSPPYADLIDYGHPDQIGRGQPYDEYLLELRRLFRALHRHTRSTGSLWVIADTLRPEREGVRRLITLPFDLAQEAEREGWILRDVVIWHKDRTRPWSGNGRLRNAFEYVLLFVKGPQYKFHLERLREPDELKQWWVRYPERYNPQGKAPGNVWPIPIPVQGSWGNSDIQHSCPLPPDLVERLVLLSSDSGEVVFDPFAGSGVVLAEAERLGRRGLGSELLEKNVDAFHRVVRAEVLQRRGVDLIAERQELRTSLRETILKLRTVKYPRALMSAIGRQRLAVPCPLLALVFRRGARNKTRQAHTLIQADVVFVIDDSYATLGEYEHAARTAAQRPPASKFGVAGTISAIRPEQLRAAVRGRRLYAYRRGRTHRSEGAVRHRDLLTIAEHARGERIPPILSTVEVDEVPRELRGDGEVLRRDLVDRQT